VQEQDEASERYFWGMLLRILWASLILLLVAGLLASLTAILVWYQYPILCFLGLLAGLSIAAALGSLRTRDLMSLILGAFMLPLLGVYLAGIAARSPAEFSGYSAMLFPFFAYATGALLARFGIAWVWRTKPERTQPDAQGKPVPGTLAPEAASGSAGPSARKPTLVSQSAMSTRA